MQRIRGRDLVFAKDLMYGSLKRRRSRSIDMQRSRGKSMVTFIGVKYFAEDQSKKYGSLQGITGIDMVDCIGSGFVEWELAKNQR